MEAWHAFSKGWSLLLAASARLCQPYALPNSEVPTLLNVPEFRAGTQHSLYYLKKANIGRAGGQKYVVLSQGRPAPLKRGATGGLISACGHSNRQPLLVAAQFVNIVAIRLHFLLCRVRPN